MFGLRSDKERSRKTKRIRTLISTALLIGSLYGSYVIWWQEKIVETALQTPEGREALARALVDAEVKDVP